MGPNLGSGSEPPFDKCPVDGLDRFPLMDRHVRARVRVIRRIREHLSKPSIQAFVPGCITLGAAVKPVAPTRATRSLLQFPLAHAYPVAEPFQASCRAERPTLSGQAATAS